MNIEIHNINDESYPERLKKLSDAPNKIFAAGKLPDETKKAVAIVGARQPSYYGREMAFFYANSLAKYDVQIISGMAKGIDAAAHEGALEAGKETFAVLGCGVDVCYPSCNRDLYNRIIENGGIISEYGAGSEPMAWHFPMRNRIISALSDIVLVIEAREKSGSLITADFALEQGKEVYALPGRVGDKLSYGCNRLISQGAGIAYNIEELLVALFHENFTTKISEIKKNFQQKNISGIASDEKKVYSCMRLQPKHINEIVCETNIRLEQVISILYSLETMGLIVEVTKNYFVLNNRINKGKSLKTDR